MLCMTAGIPFFTESVRSHVRLLDAGADQQVTNHRSSATDGSRTEELHDQSNSILKIFFTEDVRITQVSLLAAKQASQL